MSELMNARNTRNGFRRRLLTTVSALTLIGSVYAIPDAKADDDTDRPTVWIELGGQLERIKDMGEPFPLTFVGKNPSSPAFDPVSPLQVERFPQYAVGGEGKISFEPEDTNWVFSAVVRYGRSNSDKHVHVQTKHAPVPTNDPFRAPQTQYTPAVAYFQDTQAKSGESHAVVDFQAGKDVGLGVFGKPGRSVLSVGVRFAQFSEKSDVNIRALPFLQFYNAFPNPPKYFPVPHYNVYHVTGQIHRSFRGIGPTISWDVSAPFVGTEQNSDIALDWGVNAAILFGRQKASAHHQTTANSYHWKYYFQGKQRIAALYPTKVGNPSRTRSVLVPNLGGFAGLSFRYANAKVNFGYRADFFFSAMDGGVDTRKSEVTGFYGPFASISVGIGD